MHVVRTPHLVVASLVLLLSASSQAAIYMGNPKLGVRVDRPAGDYVSGQVRLDGVWVHACSGSETWYPVAQDIDPVAGHVVTISGGDLCGVTWDWGAVMTIDGDGSAGAFVVEVTDAETYVPIGSEIDPVAVESFEVVSGSMSPGRPWVLTYLQ